MSERTSRVSLILEAVFISAPLTILALLTSYLHIADLFWFPIRPYDVVLGLLALLNLATMASGWRLFAAFLHGGASELRHQPLAWWVMILVGVFILIGSIISKLLPSSPEYSRWGSFRFDFDTFAIYVPIFIPLCHLAAKRFLRQTKL